MTYVIVIAKISWWESTLNNYYVLISILMCKTCEELRQDENLFVWHNSKWSKKVKNNSNICSQKTMIFLHSIFVSNKKKRCKQKRDFNWVETQEYVNLSLDEIHFLPRNRVERNYCVVVVKRRPEEAIGERSVWGKKKVM